MLSKWDLVKQSGMRARDLQRYIHADVLSVADDIESKHRVNAGQGKASKREQRYGRLNRAVADLVDEYSMVSFVPLDPTEEDSITQLVAHMDRILQVGEDDDVSTEDYNIGA